VMVRKPGDLVRAGEPVLELHADDAARIPAALEALDGAVQVSEQPPAATPLVLDRIGG
jgi:thymidine phosphorylase